MKLHFCLIKHFVVLKLPTIRPLKYYHLGTSGLFAWTHCV